MVAASIAWQWPCTGMPWHCWWRLPVANHESAASISCATSAVNIAPVLPNLMLCACSACLHLRMMDESKTSIFHITCNTIQLQCKLWLQHSQCLTTTVSNSKCPIHTLRQTWFTEAITLQRHLSACFRCHKVPAKLLVAGKILTS